MPGAVSAEPWIALSPLAEPGLDRLPGAPVDVAAAEAEAARAAEAVAVETPAPPLTQLRVTILVPESADAGLAEAMAAEILARGHEIGAIKPVDLKISARNIRYFHDGDRGEAARLADAFDARLRDFTSFRPAPNEGTVEIWLSGDVVAAPAPAPVFREQAETPPPAVQPQIIVVTRPASFLDRLSDALWGGHSGSGLPAGSGEDGEVFGVTGGSISTGSGTASAGTTSGSGSTSGSSTSGGNGNGNSNGQGKKGG